MKAATSILLFRNDLRIADNPALQAALATGGPVIPLYIWSPEDEGFGAPGGASRWWLHNSLSALEESLRDHDSRLILRKGPSVSSLLSTVRETGAKAVFLNRRWEPEARVQDERLARAMLEAGVELHWSNGSLLFDPAEIRTSTDAPYRVFTPFSKACLAAGLPEAASYELESVPPPAAWPKSEDLDSFGLLPTIDWAGGLREAWIPGEKSALATLDRFAGKVEDYRSARNKPDGEGVSRLSPHLHFGEISPRQIVSALRGYGAEPFIRQILWREFAYHLLTAFPETPLLPLNKDFSKFPSHLDSHAVKAWQKGLTGYPIVDAGMRELWATGYMHNRVRLVAASFLVKDLLIPWQEGAAWFWDTLVDADLANNTMGWQWVAGCGADAAPYFRIFNPVRQGEKFDPEGSYVRRWLPELALLPNEWIHHPWDAPEFVLEKARVKLGRNYPHPIVDHNVARSRALNALAAMRGEAQTAHSQATLF